MASATSTSTIGRTSTKAIRIADNAKTQRYGTCNTMETLLVHKDIAAHVLPPLAKIYADKGVELRGDEAARAIVAKNEPATEEDCTTEYLAPILSVRDRRRASTTPSITSPCTDRSIPMRS